MDHETLWSPKRFHTWYAERVSEGASADCLLDEIGNESDIARCRQLCVGYWLGHPQLENLLQDCLFSADPRIEAYALSYDLYRATTRIATSKDGNFAEAYNHAPVVQRGLRELARERGEFSWEAEASLRLTMSVISFFKEDYAAAEEEAALGRYRAIKVGAKIHAARLINMLISVRAQAGEVVSALKLVEQEEHSPYTTVANLAFQERARALFEYHLGNHAKAITRLSEGTKTYDKPSTGHQPFATELQRLQGVLGIGGVNGPIQRGRTTDKLSTCINRSLRHLVNVMSLPKSGKSLAERESHLTQVVNIWTTDTYRKSSWGKNLGAWILGVAQLWLGKTSLALRNIEKVDVRHTQWLDLRVLCAGLKLELAFSFYPPSFSTEASTNELREVFELARNDSSASAEGLAAQLTHWHPAAAIYCSFMPDSIKELQGSVEGLLKAGHRNEVYGIQLPPSLAAELVLRSLDFDLRPDINFVQADPGPSRSKMTRLRVKHGEVDYWRPCTSAVRIIYGFVKAGHLDIANAVYHEFGVSPRSSSGYSMLPLVEIIDAAVSDLLAQKISPDIFAKKLALMD